MPRSGWSAARWCASGASWRSRCGRAARACWGAPGWPRTRACGSSRRARSTCGSCGSPIDVIWAARDGRVLKLVREHQALADVLLPRRQGRAGAARGRDRRAAASRWATTSSSSASAQLPPHHRCRLSSASGLPNPWPRRPARPLSGVRLAEQMSASTQQVSATSQPLARTAEHLNGLVARAGSRSRALPATAEQGGEPAFAAFRGWCVSAVGVLAGIADFECEVARFRGRRLLQIGEIATASVTRLPFVNRLP